LSARSEERRHAARILSLAFLSADLVKAILDGRQPPGPRLAHLLEANIPLSWRAQRALVPAILDLMVAPPHGTVV
jgi:hypothetical protein